MRFYESVATLVAVAFATSYASASAIPSSQDIAFLDFENLVDLNEIWEGVNVTDVARAIKSDHPHANLKTPEVIELYGYNAETHIVETEDGYILTMHRITGNSTHKSPDGKPAVLLMHGIFCSSMDWVVAGPERGLGFLLADAGYDVWFGNARGNTYSRKHKNVGTATKAFWYFSWHEIGYYDIPAKIDYILEKTANKKLFFIGHSQGATSFFVTTSTRPEYNDKIGAMFSLAPVTFSENLFSPLFRILAKYVTTMKKITDAIGIYQFLPDNRIIGPIAKKVCNDASFPAEICVNVIFAFTGFNKEQFDMELLPAILSHLPAGASMYQLYHYGQLIKSGYFRQFDYGWYNNWKKYKKFTPPDYELVKVTAPIYLHYSENDWLAHVTDVKTLQSKLPNVHKLSCVPNKKFNHLDFLWAKDVKTLLYHEIMDHMSEHVKGNIA